MGSGVSGLYSGAVPGDADYMPKTDIFSRFISRRKDIDPDGFFDIIAHGTENSIFIVNNGVSVEIDHRSAARLIRGNKKYKRQSIRLLSCNTGTLPDGFAQRLADKLGVIVIAPTKLLWAKPSGSYYVAGRDPLNPEISNRKDKGNFETFTPGKRKKK